MARDRERGGEGYFVNVRAAKHDVLSVFILFSFVDVWEGVVDVVDGGLQTSEVVMAAGRFKISSGLTVIVLGGKSVRISCTYAFANRLMRKGTSRVRIIAK